MGPGHVVASVNIRLRVQDRAGTILRTVSYGDFWAPLATSADISHPGALQPFDDRGSSWALTDKSSPRHRCSSASADGRSMDAGISIISVADVDPAGQLWPDYRRSLNKDWIVAQVKVFPGNFTLQFFRSTFFSKTNLYRPWTLLAEQSTTEWTSFRAFPAMSFEHHPRYLRRDAGAR